MNVIIDYRTSAKSVDALRSLGFNVIKTPKIESVHDSICGHSDIMVHKTDNNTVICEPTVYKYFSRTLQGIKVMEGKTTLKEKYPYDIAYNAARVGNCIICNEKFTDDTILEFCFKNNIKIINTKQGYAKCSTCVVSDNAIITSDKNIAQAAEKNGIEALFINDEDVKLPGFDHGFFGGATGLIKEGLLAVNGDLKLHSDACKIVEFAQKHKVKVISLSDGDITDIGSIITI